MLTLLCRRIAAPWDRFSARMLSSMMSPIPRPAPVKTQRRRQRHNTLLSRKSKPCLWHANQCPPCQPPCKILDHMRVLSWSCEVRFFRYHDQRPFGAKKMHPVMLGVLHVAPTDPSSYQNPLYRTYR